MAGQKSAEGIVGAETSVGLLREQTHRWRQFTEGPNVMYGSET